MILWRIFNIETNFLHLERIFIKFNPNHGEKELLVTLSALSCNSSWMRVFQHCDKEIYIAEKSLKHLLVNKTN